MENNEDLSILISEEFARIGFMAKPRDVAALTDALVAQGADYTGNEIALMAACAGYASAKGARF